MNFNSGLVNDGHLRKNLAAAGHLLVVPMHEKGWSFLAVPFLSDSLKVFACRGKDPFITRGTGIPGIRKSELIL
jgi:hypothetical protein